MSRRVAIVGASGTVGTFITDALLKSKSPIFLTAITRKGAGHTFPSGVNIAEVDYDIEESLVNALQGNEVLVISLGVTAPSDTQDRLLRAAVKAKVTYIFPNEFTFEFDPVLNHAFAENVLNVYHEKADFRKEVERAGLKWIGISHGFWYEFSVVSTNFVSFGIVVKEKKAVIIGDGNVKAKAVTWRQVGEAYEKIISGSLEKYGNTQVSFNSFLLSQNDILDSILRVTHDSRENWDIKYVDEKEWIDENLALISTPQARIAYSRILYARHFWKDQEELGKKYDKRHNKELGLVDEDLDEATLRGIELGNSGFVYAK